MRITSLLYHLLHLKSIFLLIHLLRRDNETWVRLKHEGKDTVHLELGSGFTYRLRRRTEVPAVWTVDDDQVFKRESDTKVRKIGDYCETQMFKRRKLICMKIQCWGHQWRCRETSAGLCRSEECWSQASPSLLSHQPPVRPHTPWSTGLVMNRLTRGIMSKLRCDILEQGRARV